MGCNKDYIIIVQGDTADITIDLKGEAVEVVKSVELTIGALGVKKSASKVEDGEWVVSFSSAETKAMRHGLMCYCITITFTDNKITTTVYDGVVSVRQKE